MPRRPPTHWPPKAKVKDGRPTRTERGYGPHWQRLRAAYLANHPFCSEPGCTADATEVDHVQALKKGGAHYDERNLRAYCKSCHSRKTLREDGAWGRKRGEGGPGVG